ncbi:MAG TPA: alpha/beta hydrolase, partial [Caulobacteraceae bacterium]|nr:alpha/beta hydrolase [Caulobacteraceae bacterium]
RNGEASYATSDLGADVCALIAVLGYERAHLFGTSFGGIIAQEAALAEPSRIDRLVLSASWPGGAWPVTDAFYAVVRAEKTPDQAREYRKMFFSAGFAAAHPDEVEARMQKVMTTRTPEQQARRAASNVLHDDAPQRLPRIANQTLALAGADDRIVSPQFSARLAELIPNARLQVLEDLGHATTIEDPARVAAAVRAFLLAPEA